MYQPITYSLLKEKNAFYEDLNLFKEHFGETEAVPLTTEGFIQLGKIFEMIRAANILLTKEDFEEYKKVTHQMAIEYTKVTDPALIKYTKIYGKATEEYNKTLSNVDYRKVMDTAWIEYMNVRSTAIAELNKVVVPIFIDIYKKGMKTP